MSRREQIRMSDEEVRAFLEEQMVMTVGTIGPNGRPHLMALWYVPDGLGMTGLDLREVAEGQEPRARPARDDPGRDGVQYHELRGVMMECDVELDRDAKPYGMALFERYAGTLDESVTAMVEKQAPKRVGLRFSPTRIVSWDHSKLGGAY